MKTFRVAGWLLGVALWFSPTHGFATILPPLPQDEEEDDDDIFPPVFEEPQDGEGLYLQHCATCHGAKGDGKGPLVLEEPARSFEQGGFSFGNSREALFKTITSGLPGRSKMPGFKAYLTEEQRWKVVDHVRTLIPNEETISPKETELRVVDRPAVARGYLPALADGLPDWPRGLLIGSPDGLSFQYRTDDVRMLALRMGRFADRRDWTGRGGDQLIPLGQRILTFGGGDPGPSFARIFGEDAEPEPLGARFRGTWIRDHRAGLRSELVAGRSLATVSEELRVEAVTAGTGFTRRLELRGEIADLAVGITGGQGDRWEALGGESGRPWLAVTKRDDGALVCFPHDRDTIRWRTTDTEIWWRVPDDGELAITYLLVEKADPELIETAYQEIVR